MRIRNKSSSSAAEATRVLFRADVPPEDLEGERDAFGHKGYATALATALLEAEAPFTFGLFAPFGLGKTTIIEEIKRQVQPKAAMVVFDAWRYEGDTLRRHFLREVGKSLEEDDALNEGWVNSHLTELDQATTEPGEQKIAGVDWSQVIELIIRAAFAAAVFFVVWHWAVPAAPAGSVIGALITVIVTLALFVGRPLPQMLRIVQQQVAYGELKPELFATKFGDMIEDLKKSRLIVAIDNLDRCSPERVEEVFFTLSSYLEPIASLRKRKIAISPRRQKEHDAIFLIAADDEALMRHLRGRERTVSRGGNVFKTRRQDTGRYADDYLRKIVKSRVSVRPVLPDDMRRFVRLQLDDFIGVRCLGDEDAAKLVELTTSALKRNPRRVKEFASNLELQLRVIEAREQAGAIHPPLSRDVVLVAKARLLEEEWPELFARLLRDPRLLADWDDQIVRGTFDGYATEDGLGLESDEIERFAVFMNVGRSIPNSNLRALLRLKQSEAEIALPRFSEFYDALVEGRSGTVTEIINENPRHVAAYAERLPDLLAEELDRHYLAGARNLIQVAVETQLREQSGPLLALMQQAANSPTLRTELVSVPPEHLVAAAAALGDPELNRFVEPWLDLPAFVSRGEDVAAEVSEALGPLVSRLSPSNRKKLIQAVSSEEVIGHPAAYRGIAEAAANLLTDEVGEKLIEHLQSDLDVTSDAYAVFTRWASVKGRVPAPISTFVGLLITRINALFAVTFEEDDDEVRGELVAWAQTLRLIPKIDNEAADSFISACANAFPQVLETSAVHESSLVPEFLDALAVVTNKRGAVSTPANEVVASYHSHSAEDFFEFGEKRGADLGKWFGWAFLLQLRMLVENAAAANDVRMRATVLAATLDADHGEEILAGSLTACAKASDFEFARTLYSEYARTSAFNGYEREIPLAVIEGGRAASGISDDWIALVEEIAALLTDEDLEAIREILDEGLASSDLAQRTEAAKAADRLRRSIPTFVFVRERLLRELFDSVAQEDVPADGHAQIISERADALDHDRRQAFVARLVHWLNVPGPHQLAIAQAATALESPTATERFQLVEVLVTAETSSIGDATRRCRFLVAAQALEGDHRTRASKRFRARLAVLLQEGGDENQAVLECVRTG